MTMRIFHKQGLRFRLTGLIFALAWPILIFSQNSVDEAKNPPFEVSGNYSRVLRFEKIWKDYVVFYDSKDQYYLRYRIDQWDYDNNEIIKDFVDSVEYNITFTYQGEVFSEADLIERQPDIIKKVEKKKIRNKKNVYYGIYKSHKNSQVDSIRF